MATKIKYKSRTINLPSGEALALHTEGKKLTEDIIITNEVDGGEVSGVCDRHHIVEVEELPTTGIDTETIYKQEFKLLDIGITYFGEHLLYLEMLQQETGMDVEIISVQDIPTSDIKINLMDENGDPVDSKMYLYYIKSIGDLGLYVQEAGQETYQWNSFLATADLPFLGSFYDIPYELIESGAAGYFFLGQGGYFRWTDTQLEDLLLGGQSARANGIVSIYVKTTPTEGIFESFPEDDLYYMYYIEDLNDVFMYTAGSWISGSQIYTGTQFGGVIYDAADAIDEESYYALVRPASMMRMVPENEISHPPAALEEITITQNGTYTANEEYDGFGEVTVKVTPLYPVSSYWDMNTIRDSASDSMIGAVYKYTGSTNTSYNYEENCYYMLKANIKGYYFEKIELSDVTIGELTYQLSSDGTYYAIKSYGTSAAQDLIIPPTMSEIPVNKIADNAFYDCERLRSVTFPGSIDEIGKSAFYSCGKLKTLTFLGVPNKIKDSAFNYSPIDQVNISDIKSWCENGTISTSGGTPFGINGNGYLCINNAIVTDLEIPETVIEIKDSAFHGCGSIEALTLPSTLQTIKSYAFSRCRNLTDVQLNDGLTTLGSYAFHNCQTLPKIEIPSSMTTINSYAFGSCPALIEVRYKGTLDSWMGITFTGIDSNPLCNGADLYCNDILIADLQIPEDLTAIPSYVFYKCKSISSLTIGNSVQTIGKCAFSGCKNLVDINMSNQVTKIDDGAFEHCSKISSIEIPNTTTEIGSNAFYYCSGLTDVNLGQSVTSIGGSAFQGCASLTSIELPDSVTSIGGSAFYDCSALANVKLPAALTELSGGIFSTCPALVTIDIPDSVESIKDNAFYNCRGLTTVNFSGASRLNTLADGVFQECTSLANIQLPTSLTSIGSYTFYECNALADISFPETLTSLGTYAFANCSSLQSVTINDSLLKIPNGAFNSCKNLTTVALPEGLTHIGDYAFSFSEALNDITLPSTLTNIGYEAFRQCRGLTHIELPASVTTMSSYVFEDCSGLTSVIIPATVTKIPNYTFTRCTALSSITYLGTMEQWSAVTKGNGWNNGCPATEVVCSDGTVSLT